MCTKFSVTTPFWVAGLEMKTISGVTSDSYVLASVLVPKHMKPLWPNDLAVYTWTPRPYTTGLHIWVTMMAALYRRDFQNLPTLSHDVL